MPGLFGILTLEPGAALERARTESLMTEMGRRLAHMGGEVIDSFIEAQAGMAIGRIGAPGLQATSWPAAWHVGRSLFIDGVVHEDIAPAAELLAQNPEDDHVLRQLEGFWSAAIALPNSERRLTLAVDRHASRPIFWTVSGGKLYFAPEVKALLAVPDLVKKVDPAALGMFFASGFVLQGRTMFSGIERLEGGSSLHVERGAVKVERYADYCFSVDGDGTPYEEMKSELGQCMRRAVERNYQPSASQVIFLSGGKDSRAIIASAVAAADDPSTVHAVSWTANEPQPGSDVYLARQLADRLGVQWTSVQRRLDGFAPQALRLNYILDCLTDVGSYHGDELRLMELLAANGAQRVLRGDQCFTRGRSMLDPAYAILRMCLRSPSGLSSGKSAWHAEPWAEACAGADSWLADLAAEYADVQQDNTGDQVYFRHRLQGYLNSAGYFKQLVLDHRNPLLDENLLRFIQRLSIDARREQRVLNEALAETFPQLADIPYAERSNLEDFGDLLARDTPVRRAVAQELADEDSAVWDYFDRKALLARLRNHGTSGKGTSWKSRGRKWLKETVSKAVYDIPAIDVRLRGVYLKRLTREDEVFLRVLSLKHFFDLFVTGDGSREAYEARADRLAK